MLDYQDNFLSIDLNEAKSPYLRELIVKSGGQIDDHLQSLLHLEKYMRGVRPYSAQMIIRMMISGIAHKHPIKAEIMHRELEGGKPFDPAELDEIARVAPERIKDFDVFMSPRGAGWAKARFE